ncbi:MAG: hypothetical protein JW741_10295 [Sedimentisphaerales bacterium]|nr:hypothetical protein [Sedimentisphaerales bacterium]
MRRFAPGSDLLTRHVPVAAIHASADIVLAVPAGNIHPVLRCRSSIDDKKMSPYGRRGNEEPFSEYTMMEPETHANYRNQAVFVIVSPAYPGADRRPTANRPGPAGKR